ncbi:MFS transporter [Sabulicella rubraurantiaca]|uniref:MFS transporter n=1 Tax=Sabulicella rubraurantiaca TaxID=2811429 RepID=UPI001A971BE7|nr:MFS transporter [Sabulicella rubraurantiaca]
MSQARPFALAFAAQFLGFGAALPFLPAILAAGGLSAGEVGTVLAAGSIIRLLSAPLLGQWADRNGDARRVLLVAALVAGLAALGFGLLAGFALLLAVQLLHAAAAAPVMPLTDALALRAGGFDYARVRAAGSVSFIAGAVLAGFLADATGPRAAAFLLAGGMFATALVAPRLPRPPSRPPGEAPSGPLWAPWREAGFRRLLPLSAAVQGSHAVLYGFSAIHWQASGLSPGQVGLLWATGVVAEIVLFLKGGALTAALGKRGLALLAAGAGVVRWGATAVVVDFWTLLPLQALHGLTFGAMHLATMRALLELPAPLAARAQTLHVAAVGAAMGSLTFAGGWLYAGFGGLAFWAMAGLCVLALPLAARLR